MEAINKQLHNTRSQGKLLLLSQATSILLALIVFAIMSLVFIDWALRFPSALRLLLLIALVVWCLWVIRQFLWPATQFNPTLTEVALRVEKKRPELANHLASSIDFVQSGEDKINPLAARCVKETERRLQRTSIKGVINKRGPMGWGGVALAGVIVAVILVSINPTNASVGVQRVLLPFGKAAWPARTSVQSLMTDAVGEKMVYPRGQALHLKAQNTTPQGEDERVEATYRYLINEQWAPWQTIVLTHQRNGLHERLVDTNAGAIEVLFSTSDSQTDIERVNLIPPPSIESAQLQVVPPDYAAELIEPLTQDLGQGVDRLLTSKKPVLARSNLTLHMKLNKAIPIPEDPSDQQAWLRKTMGFTGDVLPSFEHNPEDPSQWKMEWTADKSMVMSLDLQDVYGLRNQDLISYRIDVVEDRIPEIAILEPKVDEAVLATALIPIEVEARDDVGLSEVGLELTPFTDDTSTVPPALWMFREKTNQRLQRLMNQIDLGTLQLVEGDELALWGLASDRSFGEEGGNNEVRSQPRRLRIINTTEFLEQVRQNLGGVRQSAIQIESLQQELEAVIRSEGLSPGMDRQQGRLVQRMAQQQELIGDLADLVEMNQLDDELLAELLDEIENQMSLARNAGARAVASIEEGLNAQEATNGDKQEPSPPETQATEAATQNQETARASLASLIALLDRDQDAWVVTRKIESLIDEQNQLIQETNDLAQQTLGRPSEALTQKEQDELNRLAQEQDRLGEEAQEMVESLQDRADDLETLDEQAAEALARAAQTAESQELSRDMERASDRLEQNQMNVAQNAQRAAEQTLERMLEEVKDTKRVQVEELLRQLASLMESIQNLISVQERELELLDIAIEQDNFKNRDREMMRLQQNTFAVENNARATDVSAASVGQILSQAGAAQGKSIGVLRTMPIDGALAKEHELQSLLKLQEALKETEKLNDDTERQEMDARREELVQKYRDELQKQVVVISETKEVNDNNQSARRKRFEARRLGGVQEEIRSTITELRDTTTELMETPIFNHVHALIINWSKSAEEDLLSGETNRDVTDQQDLIARGISSIIDALEEANQPPSEFEDGQANEGGEGQGQQGQGEPALIPPIAELKLLRSTQEQIYNQTQIIDAREDLQEVTRVERLDDIAQQQVDLLQLGQEMLKRLQESQGATE